VEGLKLSSQEDIGKAILDLKSLYPQATTCERADLVFDHVAKYGSPPLVVAPIQVTNGSGAGK
jgi:hypothetical protein